MRTIFEIHLAGESDARETAEMSRDLIEKGLVWTQWPKRLLAMVTHPEYAVIAKIVGFAVALSRQRINVIRLARLCSSDRRIQRRSVEKPESILKFAAPTYPQ